MTRLTLILIIVAIFAFLGLSVVFGSTVMAKTLIALVIGGAVALVIGSVILNWFKARKQ